MNQSEIAYIKLKRLKARVYRIVFENASISVDIISHVMYVIFSNI